MGNPDSSVLVDHRELLHLGWVSPVPGRPRAESSAAVPDLAAFAPTLADPSAAIWRALHFQLFAKKCKATKYKQQQ